MSTVIPSIFNPLLAISLRASLFEDKILLSTTKSKILIPFFISLDLICISGKSDPKFPFSKVSFAVFSAFFEASLPWSILVASFASKIFKLFIYFFRLNFCEKI